MIYCFQFFPLSNESIHINIKEDSEYAYLRHHKINNEIIIPPSFFMVRINSNDVEQSLNHVKKEEEVYCSSIYIPFQFEWMMSLNKKLFISFSSKYCSSHAQGIYITMEKFCNFQHLKPFCTLYGPMKSTRNSRVHKGDLYEENSTI